MPHKCWRHYCTASLMESRRGVEVCPNCGAQGEPVGWSYSMHEAMWAYEERTGFKPIGAHRMLADLLLAPMLRLCDFCAGRGLIDKGDDDYKCCPNCRGLTAVRTVSDAEFDACRRRIAAEFPDAVANP